MKRKTRISVHIEERLVIRTRPSVAGKDANSRPFADRLRNRLRSLFESQSNHSEDKTTWNEE